MERCDGVMFAARYDPEDGKRESVSEDTESERESESGSESESESEKETESESEKETESESESETGNTGKTGETRKSIGLESVSDSDSDSGSQSRSDSDVEMKEVDASNSNIVSDSSKHKSVLKKLRTSLSAQKAENSTSNSDSDESSVPTHDLAPLPQPALPRDQRLTATTNHIGNLDWLATPIYASTTETVPFSSFGLSSSMVKDLQSNGFSSAFSVQVSVLKLLLPDMESQAIRPDIGGDLLVNAATGSGKTLGYAIPIIESLRNRIVPRVRAIVLVPTKPLISQVKATFAMLSKNTNLSVVSLRSDISINDEAQRLQVVPDIIVSTPGRLVEHLTNGHINLKSLRYLVIDEADRLLNQSFQNWCETLMSRIDSNPILELDQTWRPSVQKLVFSATLTTDAGRLSMLKLQRPRLIIVNDRHELVNELFTVPATLQEYKLSLGSARSSAKPLVLAKFLMSEQKLVNTLVFAKSNEASLRLCRLLQLLFRVFGLDVTVSYLNSTNNAASTRAKILKDFANQTVHILVVTDLIARGIDIATITNVINYDLPNSSRDYVHRVGRTARANQDGEAYTMCFGKGETKWFTQLVREVSRQTEVKDVEKGFRDLVSREDEAKYDTCLEELQRQVFEGV